MKNGAIVKIIDGSFNRVISKDLNFEDELSLAVKDELFEIMQTNITIRSRNCCGGSEMLDIMLRALKDNRIVFTKEQFLKLHHVCNVCPNCGKHI